MGHKKFFLTRLYSAEQIISSFEIKRMATQSVIYNAISIMKIFKLMGVGLLIS